ncbi:MAG TPA: DUF2062 domain-containing protein [Paracoccaceae bacterium]|nr:DUF2062 domain-containing protein [Paracoccaceae bacterium]
MIFRRRERPSTRQRLREALAPRKGWRRGFDYISKRMRRLPDSPHRIALGFACGAFASFTPLFGLHFILAAVLAWMARGNVLAALFGTAVGNPLTFPLISGTALYTGRWMMGRNTDGGNFEAISHAFVEGLNAIWGTVKSWFGHGPSMLDGLLEFAGEIFLPYLVGGIVPGLIAAVVSYWVIGPIVAAYQERRRRKLFAVQARRRAQLDAELSAYENSDSGEGDNA